MAMTTSCLMLLSVMGPALLLAAEPLSTEPSEEVATLAADDECNVTGPGSEVGCALEALQFRGKVDGAPGAMATLKSTGPYNTYSSHDPYASSPYNHYSAHGPHDPYAHGPYPPHSPYDPFHPLNPSMHGPYPPHTPMAPYPPHGPYPPHSPYDPSHPGSHVDPHQPRPAYPHGPHHPGSHGPHDPYRPGSHGPYDPYQPGSHGPFPAPDRMVGGDCKAYPCAASRGKTKCGPKTNYKCMCKRMYYARFGSCIKG